jgi:hypothetical protein
MALGIWRKQKDSGNIPVRITRLDKQSLLDWYNTTIMELGAAFDRYRYQGSSLDQLDELVEILNNLHREVGSRERNNH